MSKTPCEKCQEKKCLLTGKPCELVESILKSDGIRSSNWIRPEFSKKKRKTRGRFIEIPFSHLQYDQDNNTYIDPLDRRKKEFPT